TLADEIELGQLQGEDGRPLLAARGEGRQVAARYHERDVVAMRSDEGGAVPELLLGRFLEPAGERIPRRLARSRRGGGDVRPPEPAGLALLGRDLARGVAERTREPLEKLGAGGDDRAARVEEWLVPVAEVVSARGLVTDRPQQPVALLQRATIGGKLGPVPG